MNNSYPNFLDALYKYRARKPLPMKSDVGCITFSRTAVRDRISQSEP